MNLGNKEDSHLGNIGSFLKHFFTQYLTPCLCFSKVVTLHRKAVKNGCIGLRLTPNEIASANI